ncbi:calpastatin [Stegastes partitus]|uniref:Calpastatin n=1 Tax=Stegastes partitus TaxID=144197 RepID=A0A9Y4JSD0_9TELE|nr:PREDICTED: calpastatin [Stegastes partitus]
MAYAKFWEITYGKGTSCDHEVQHGSRSSAYSSTRWSYNDKSQPSQATPKPAAQVSTGKPAEFEKASSGSAMATKPGVVTTATGGATGSGVTTGGSAAVGTAKAKPETNTTLVGATVIDMTSAGASGGPREMLKTAPASQVKSTAAVSSAAGAAATAAGTAATTAVGKAKESPKGTTKVQVEVPAATVTGVKETLKSVAPEKPAAGKATDVKPKTSQGGSMSLDALSSLGDLLPTDAPKPKAPEEGKHKKEEGVLVGERDDTLPPDYRFNREALEKLPAPKPEPTIGTGEALDFLSDALTTPLATSVVDAPVVLPTIPPCEVTVEDVSAMSVPSGNVISSSTASGVHAPAPPSTRRTPAKPDAAPVKPKDTKPKTDKVAVPKYLIFMASLDTALDALAGDFIPSTAASAVSSAPCEPDLQLPAAADNALDALSDTLADIKPAPQPVPVLTKDVVKEKKILEERLIKMGERDDTLPPEFRPTEEDLKKMEEEKAKAAAKPKEKGMDDTTALDLLSSDFSDTPKPAAPAVTSSAATAKLQPPVLDSEPLKPMAGPVLDSLADTLLPDKSKTDKAKGKSKSKSKSKKHHAEDPSAPDQLSAQQSSDVVPASTKKGGKR